MTGSKQSFISLRAKTKVRNRNQKMTRDSLEKECKTAQPDQGTPLGLKLDAGRTINRLLREYSETGATAP